jgi:hypothetical protein
LESILDIYPLTDGAPEIESLKFRILKESDNYENKELASYVGRTVRAFISYATKDKNLAGNLKESLEKFGLEVFLAHEDITPSSEWQDEILRNLKSTDIFMPLITDSFSESFWTDQESGIALSENKFILPIAVDGHLPYGFLGKIQAYKHNSKISISTDKIIEAIIISKPEFSSPLLDSLIKAFALSHSFDDAGAKSALLLQFDEINDEQANEIFRAVVNNDQILGSRSARGNITSLFRKCQKQIDKKLLEELKSKKELSFWFEP